MCCDGSPSRLPSSTQPLLCLSVLWPWLAEDGCWEWRLRLGTAEPAQPTHPAAVFISRIRYNIGIATDCNYNTLYPLSAVLFPCDQYTMTEVIMSKSEAHGTLRAAEVSHLPE